jgi:hypothetical protein
MRKSILEQYRDREAQEIAWAGYATEEAVRLRHLSSARHYAALSRKLHDKVGDQSEQAASAARRSPAEPVSRKKIPIRAGVLIAVIILAAGALAAAWLIG